MSSYWEYQELAGRAMGWNQERIDDEVNGDEDFNTPLYEHFNVDFEQFMAVAEALLELTPLVQSPLTGDCSHAFVKHEDNGTMVEIVSKKVIT